MKRRSFVRSVTVSAFGVGMVPSRLIALTQPSASLVENVRQIGWAVQALKWSKSYCGSAALSQLMHDTDQQLAALGYREVSDSCFISGPDDAYCYYPLMYCHARSGATEVLAPVFHRTADGKWKLLKTLSGFQIEALAKAAAAFPTWEPAQLHDLLFPSNREPVVGVGGKYYTNAGSVTITTTIQKGKAHTSCVIHGKSGVEFSDSFTSRHSLTC